MFPNLIQAWAGWIQITSSCTFSKTRFNIILSNTGVRCWWHSWLRHCATSQKVTGSIPDCVTVNFHWHNPFGRTMALGLTQSLTEMSTRNISWRVKAAVPKADNFTTFMCRLSWNLVASTSWNPQDLSRAVMGLLIPSYTSMIAT